MSFIFTVSSKTDPFFEASGIELAQSTSGLFHLRHTVFFSHLKVKVGNITMAQARDIATLKMADLNANDLDAASLIIAGTARSMGITVNG